MTLYLSTALACSLSLNPAFIFDFARHSGGDWAIRLNLQKPPCDSSQGCTEGKIKVLEFVMKLSHLNIASSTVLNSSPLRFEADKEGQAVG